jgi:hypothetical protein
MHDKVKWGPLKGLKYWQIWGILLEIIFNNPLRICVSIGVPAQYSQPIGGYIIYFCLFFSWGSSGNDHIQSEATDFHQKNNGPFLAQQLFRKTL